MKKGTEKKEAKAKVVVVTDSETRTVTALTNHALPKTDKKGKGKDALKKAKHHIVPQAIANQKNLAAIAA
jgi:DNA-binding MurR/RpiR family transcriptional regulator